MSDANLISLSNLQRRFVCQFGEYRFPIVVLVEIDGTKFIASVENDLYYRLSEVAWDDLCDEFICDFYRYYRHCFYVDGKRLSYCDKATNLPLSAFEYKWGQRNPILERCSSEASD